MPNSRGENITGGFHITPDTKVGVLLDRYPHIEEALISMSPAFAKIRNPVLRKTIAKVATLRQVAKVGGIPLAALINGLRSELGHESVVQEKCNESGRAASPPWLDRSAIVGSLDVRPVIDAGRNPMGDVRKRLNSLAEGEIFELIAPFVPAPLIDQTRARGFKAWSEERDQDCVITYFARE